MAGFAQSRNRGPVEYIASTGVLRACQLDAVTPITV